MLISQPNLNGFAFCKKTPKGSLQKKTAYFMTYGKKVGGPKTKTKFQKIFLIWTRSQGGR